MNLRRIYILPTRQGVVLGFVLLAMLLGSINYSLSLGFLFTFLIAALAIVSILHAFFNLLGLTVEAGRCPPVFAGEVARFALVLGNLRGPHRFNLRLQGPDGWGDGADLPAQGCHPLHFHLPASRRGRLAPHRLCLETTFPLGLFRAWTLPRVEVVALVYPRPESEAPPPPFQGPEMGQGRLLGAGNEDFSGFRPYRPGDSPRHVAWRLAARNGKWLIKQFEGQARERVWLDWEDMPPGLGVEARLSRLCAWVLDAAESGMDHGLRLPGVEIPPASGVQHRERCLEALALFPDGETLP